MGKFAMSFFHFFTYLSSKIYLVGGHQRRGVNMQISFVDGQSLV